MVNTFTFEYCKTEYKTRENKEVPEKHQVFGFPVSKPE